MTFWRALIGFVIIFICIYTIIDGVCACIEKCSNHRLLKILLDDYKNQRGETKWSDS